MINLLHGDSLELLKTLPDNSVDSLVIDPPAAISFMGKSWDTDKGGKKQWIEWLRLILEEAKRVLKPGAHGFIWALPRTSHWTMNAIEDAGYDIRDVISHIFATGFPKGVNISKGIDKKLCANREVVGTRQACDIRNRSFIGSPPEPMTYEYTSNTTDEAKKWNGWNTALKPATEYWILIRKPISEKTIVDNVLRWGTGAINMGACRVPCDPSSYAGSNYERYKDSDVVMGWQHSYTNKAKGEKYADSGYHFKAKGHLTKPGTFAGDPEYKPLTEEQLIQTDNHPDSRWPANLIHDGETLEDLGRFFYCAKANKVERNAGCEDLPDGANRINAPRENEEAKFTPKKNSHPTVKPLALMKYLCKLITPPEGVVLDCFMGSGSTGVASIEEGFSFIGIEMEKEYFDIAVARITNSKK